MGGGVRPEPLLEAPHYYTETLLLCGTFSQGEQLISGIDKRVSELLDHSRGAQHLNQTTPWVHPRIATDQIQRFSQWAAPGSDRRGGVPRVLRCCKRSRRTGAVQYRVF